MDLAAKRVIVMGLGRFGGGIGVTRYCVGQGADVLVTDTAPAEELADSLKQLEGLRSVEYRLGEHNVSDFTTADLIVVNPAVDRRENRFLRAAAAAGVAMTSEIELLVAELPNRLHTIGVTGTAGKSTVTAMLGHVLERAFPDERVHVGGNLGGSLLDRIHAKHRPIHRDDWVVLELSSFMLEPMQGQASAGWSPHVAIVTNLSPNHLDRHGDFEQYVNAKQSITLHQRDGDKAVFGPGVAELMDAGAGDLIEVDHVSPFLKDLAVPGEHNRLNASLAITALDLLGIDPRKSAKWLGDFRGLPHRLQLVAEPRGVRCFNDSKSTTPASAMLAIDAFAPQTVHAILGGYDKGSDLTGLAVHAAKHCRAIYTIGKTGHAISEAAEASLDHGRVERCGDLEAAVSTALKRAASGDVILLSPGCASYDQFENYQQRGEAFVRFIHAAEA